MKEVKGKYNTAKIFTDAVDKKSIDQVKLLCDQEFVEGSKIRMMPDIHAGAGCTIGTTMTVSDKIVPNLVGVDIGCFTGDTEVWCSAGFYKPIKELAERNEPFMTDSFDEKTALFYSSLATAFKTRKNADLVEVTYAGKTSLYKPDREVKVRCTPDHKFLVCYENNGTFRYSNETYSWVEASKLRPGTRLVAEDANIVVKDVKVLEEKEDVYCLHVPVYHNFSIKLGVIVHNCGMHVTKLLLREEDVDFETLDKVIREYIPSGFNIRKSPHKYIRNINLTELDGYSAVDTGRAYCSVGTLGGGNHFIEIDKDDDGYLYLVIHSGSRHLGVEVANYYQDQAYNRLKYRWTKEREMLIKSLRANGREKDISTELAKCTFDIPKDLAYIDGLLFWQYLHDMEIVQEYAKWNRMAIADTIVEKMGWGWKRLEEFTTIHNYIDTDDMILRKGAVSAKTGEKLLIPINMRDGSLICVGKGNPDWNYSAPHGAGRLFGRMAAKELFSVDEFKEQMNGVYTTSVNDETLDECPMAYKSMESIVNNIGDTVDILKVIKPVYNFKAGDCEVREARSKAGEA